MVPKIVSYRVRLNSEELELVIAGLMSLRNQLMKRRWVSYKVNIDLGKTLVTESAFTGYDISAIDNLIKRLRRAPAVSNALKPKTSSEG